MTWRITPAKGGDTPYVEGQHIAESIIATMSNFGSEVASAPEDGTGPAAGEEQ